MIDTQEKLECCLSQLDSATWVALDTEADSLHAYPEKLCLLQVASKGFEGLIDPLSGISLEPLWRVLRPHEIILHGADYDLRLLRRNHGFVPEAIFDTMIASRLLGARQFGLTHLVSAHLKVELEKGPQKANWARRPLTERMADYALNDVRYLHPLSELLREDLRAKGRLAWHQEFCRRLIAEASVVPVQDPDGVWRVKGSHLLRGPGLAVLRAVWRWREEEAIAANKPPYFVLTPETMVNVAQAAVAGEPIAALLPPRMSPRRKHGVREAVDAGLQDPHPPQPLRRRGHRPTEAENRRFQALESRRNARAEALDLDPTLIASRATLMALARDWEEHAAELMSWQRELLQEE